MRIFLVLFAALLFACSGGPTEKANFAGEWMLDQEKSDVGGMGGREGGQGRRGGGFNAPNMTIVQTNDQLTVSRTFVGRDEEEITREENYNLADKESKNESRMGVKISGIKWENNGAVMVINSKTNMERGDEIFTMSSTEKWTLSENGTELEIETTMSTPRGDRTRKLYYTKK